MAEFTARAERSPDWDNAEVRRMISRCYRLILAYRRRDESEKTADRDEPGDQARTTADATSTKKRSA